MKRRECPWDTFNSLHQRGELISGEIARIVDDIGLFVRLDDGIEGIVHLNDLDWNYKEQNTLSEYDVGQIVDTLILTIEPDMRRICLGIKQLKPRPNLGGDRRPDSPTPVQPNRPYSPNLNSNMVDHE